MELRTIFAATFERWDGFALDGEAKIDRTGASAVVGEFRFTCTPRA